jgi:hypothetical protein
MEDDFRSAAELHLNDGSFLVKHERYDNAFYLLGYVVECSLKTIVESKEGAARKYKHDLGKLRTAYLRLAVLMGSAVSAPSETVEKLVKDFENLDWNPSHRYRGNGHVDSTMAGEAQRLAKGIYEDTVVRLRISGVLP